MKTSLVIMAAGIGSRFGGGIKQLEPVGPNGEIIMDYSIHDAIAAGFNKIIFIIRKDIEEDFREVIGNRIEEVAKKAGMDPATLKASADMMTKFAKQGRDDQFGKDKYYLRAVSEGPFYVVRGKLNTLTSLNGVKVNADLQVLDKNDHVIQGLYAIGHDAGGVYGDSYDLKVGEGTASAFAINSGRMAVRKILADK